MTASEKILLINIHLFNTFYCYYQVRERDSYNTDMTDDKIFFWPGCDCITAAVECHSSSYIPTIVWLSLL